MYCFFHIRERISNLHGIPNDSPTIFIFTCPHSMGMINFGFRHEQILFMFHQALKGDRYRLSVVVEELKNATTIDYKTALVAFINCLIISAPRLPDRIRVRNEFIGKLLTTSLRSLTLRFEREVPGSIPSTG